MVFCTNAESSLFILYTKTSLFIPKKAGNAPITRHIIPALARMSPFSFFRILLVRAPVIITPEAVMHGVSDI